MDINEPKKYLSEDRWKPFIICEGGDSLNYFNLKENAFEKYLISKLKDFSNE